VGTYQSGLFEFDRKKGKWTRHITEAADLLFNTVMGINEDTAGQLYIITERGLSRINPKDLSVKNFPLNTILNEYDFSPYRRILFKLDNGSFMTQSTTVL
jgi:ligand-binding sensor domain-containing protein